MKLGFMGLPAYTLILPSPVQFGSLVDQEWISFEALHPNGPNLAKNQERAGEIRTFSLVQDRFDEHRVPPTKRARCFLMSAVKLLDETSESEASFPGAP